MGGSSWGYKGGLLGAVQLKRKPPGIFGALFLPGFASSVCVGVSASVWLLVGLEWGGLGRWAMWGLWLLYWLGVLWRF